MWDGRIVGADRGRKETAILGRWMAANLVNERLIIRYKLNTLRILLVVRCNMRYRSSGMLSH